MSVIQTCANVISHLVIVLLQLVLLFFNRLFFGYPPRAILQYRVYLQLHSWVTIIIIIIKKKILQNCIPYTICAQYYIHIIRAPRASTHIHRTCTYSSISVSGGRLHTTGRTRSYLFCPLECRQFYVFDRRGLFFEWFIYYTFIMVYYYCYVIILYQTYIGTYI